MSEIKNETKLAPRGRVVGEGASGDIVLDRLEFLLYWYERYANKTRTWYAGLKISQLSAAAAIPVVSALDAPASIAAVLGSLVVVIEGVQQMLQLHQRWISHRNAFQVLLREKYLFAAQAGQYAEAADRRLLLAEKIESIASEETVWLSERLREPSGALPGQPNP
jgi:hypothetical protein